MREAHELTHGRNGSAALHRAATGGPLVTFHSMLFDGATARPAELTVRDNDGQTPLHLAFSSSNENAIETIRLWAQQSPNPGDVVAHLLRQQDALGRTPLHRHTPGTKTAQATAQLLGLLTPSVREDILNMQDHAGQRASDLAPPTGALDLVSAAALASPLSRTRDPAVAFSEAAAPDVRAWVLDSGDTSGDSDQAVPEQRPADAV